ncbi:MAG: hypothetical protein AB7S26_38455 [Sandaracinaceae bacterium]
MGASSLARFGLAVTIAAIVAACDGTPMGDCESDVDCVDGIDCTTDVCAAGNVCRNTPVDAACGAGMSCQVGMGCVSAACTDNAGCDDGVMCTNDVCGVGGTCMNMPLNERCMTDEICDPAMGCMADTGCNDNSECNDDIACTTDTCGADRTCRHTPVNEMCDTSMMEMCIPGVGCQVVIACTDESDCQDGDFCNGRELCNTEFGCMPPSGPAACTDADDCTVDMCDPTAPGENGQMGACRFDCDTSVAACMCPGPGATCSGSFSLPGATGVCSLVGGLATWTWNFQNVTFNNMAGAITVTGWTVTSSASVPPMADPGPACPNVDAVTGLSGDCNEEYRITGTFTDDNHFMGMFRATFTGAILGQSCAPCSQNIMVNGTRM